MWFFLKTDQGSHYHLWIMKDEVCDEKWSMVILGKSVKILGKCDYIETDMEVKVKA